MLMMDLPHSDVISTHGESVIWLLTITFSTLLSSTSFHQSCPPSSSSSCPRRRHPNFLGHWLQLLIIELSQLLHSVFVKEINHLHDFRILLVQRLQDWQRGHGYNAVTHDV